MRFYFTLIAQAVGKTAESTRILSEFDRAIAADKQMIADAGAAGKGFAMADGWEQGGPYRSECSARARSFRSSPSSSA